MFRLEIDDRLSGVADNEQIGRFWLLDRALSIEQGELTQKLSFRRDVIGEHFAQAIEGMYSRE